MKRLIITTLGVFFVTACQMSPDQQKAIDYKGLSSKPGLVAFGPLAGVDGKQYLLEQDALLRSSLEGKGIETSIQESTLTLDIPGNISFSPNSASINWNLHSILGEISPVLKEYKYTSILILGHSDSKGNSEVNQRLSEQRGKAIYDYFINSGVPSERLSYKGVAGNDPLITNAETTLERALNRRITLQITINKPAAAVEK
jgi:outer membrane protein OmpA-like peptidoglycan-associated protein